MSENPTNENSAPQTLLDLIQSVPLEEIDSRLCDPAKFSKEIDFDAVRSSPVLPIYLHYDWSDYGLSFDELFALTKEDDTSVSYVSFTGSPVVFSPRTDGLFHTIDYPNGLPRYLQNIPAFSVEMTFLGEVCTVSEILCFDDEWWSEDIIYFHTDKGDFVRVYSYWATEDPYVDFRMEDFQVYAKAYYELISSYDYNYDENGSGKGGGGDFISFTKEYEPVSAHKIFFLCLGAAVILGTATTITVLWLKNKKRKAAKQ